MNIQIGAKPDAGFDDPIGMLKDCHRRIERFIEVLCLVVDRARGRAMTPEETSAVQAALSYFRTGGQRHTRDEEESLFPRMRAAGVDPDELERVSGLLHDHQRADHLHAEVDRLCSTWLTEGELGKEAAAELFTATQQLKELYASHIGIEEETVFPAASQHLSPPELLAMGEEFRERRSSR